MTDESSVSHSGCEINNKFERVMTAKSGPFIDATDVPLIRRSPQKPLAEKEKAGRRLRLLKLNGSACRAFGMLHTYDVDIDAPCTCHLHKPMRPRESR